MLVEITVKDGKKVISKEKKATSVVPAAVAKAIRQTNTITIAPVKA